MYRIAFIQISILLSPILTASVWAAPVPPESASESTEQAPLQITFIPEDSAELPAQTVPEPLLQKSTPLIPLPTQPPEPADGFRKSIEKHHSKKAKSLTLALKKLQDREFDTAINLSSKLLNDPLFSDFSHWITASALRGKGEEQINQKKFDLAIQSAQKAITHLIAIETKNPYSAVIRSLPKEIAFAEFTAGKAHGAKHQWAVAQQLIERGLQRMQMQNTLPLVKVAVLSSYAESCKHKQGPLCMSWLQRLANIFARKSTEMAALQKPFPDLLEQIKYAKPAFSKLTQPYKAPDLDQVAFDASMKLYFEAQYSQAVRGFRLFLDDYPRSVHRTRVKYWLARALTHEKENDKAQKLYDEIRKESPLSYFGAVAALISKLPVESNLTGISAPMTANVDPSLFPADLFHVRRAEMLIAEKAYALAAYELKELRAKDTIASPFLVYLARMNNEARNHQSGFLILGELMQRSYAPVFSKPIVSLIFPTDYFDVVQKYANKFNLDPILVLSLVKQESAFDRNATSSSGALGLMQLMPATASDTDPNIQIADLVEADNNISVGTKYLRKLMTRYNGNIVLALAAYNAGPGSLDRWSKDIPVKRDMMEFIDSIPYKETREYVASIIRNYLWYSHLITNNSNKDLSYFWTNTPTIRDASAKLQNGNASRRRHAQRNPSLQDAKPPRL